MRSVLGIDASWTEREPSGVALIADSGSGWHLVEVAVSYAHAASFVAEAVSRHRGSMPEAAALLGAAGQKIGAPVDIVAIDIPLSMTPIVSHSWHSVLDPRCCRRTTRSGAFDNDIEEGRTELRADIRSQLKEFEGLLKLVDE